MRVKHHPPRAAFAGKNRYSKNSLLNDVAVASVAH
jgi:hypothetical protein